MIVSEDFEGDNNFKLKDVQHGLYGHVQSRVLQACSETLRLAAELFDLDLEYVERLRNLKGFDHRVLQDMHDLLAASYRFKEVQGSLPLLDRWKSQSEYETEWLDWIEKELATLLKIPDFVRSVANAAIFQNSTVGYLAEDQVRRLLMDRYKIHEWKHSSRFAKADV